MTRTVAAFDFDGTLRPGDSLLPFLRMLVPGRRLAAAVGGAWRELAMLAAGGTHRDRAKEAVIARALAGVPLEVVEEAAALYARRIEGDLRQDVLGRLRWHADAGHEVVIVSASPEHYLVPLAERLGVVAVLGTRLEGRDGRLTGRLVGANVRGPEKVRRLSEWLVGEPVTLWAYGNSAGDADLLAGADRATWVGRGRIPREPPADHTGR